MPDTDFFQSFETNEGEVYGGLTGGAPYGSFTIVTPGPSGLQAADGSSYALLTETPSDNGTDGSGPFTKFGDYSNTFTDGATAGVKVYLDTTWATGQGFEYSVAANGTDGLHQRDFVFEVVKNTSGQLVVATGNGADFMANPDLQGTPVPESGWYTLQHVFHEIDGHLAVDFNLVSEDGEVTHLGTVETEDAIAEVGGNRYGWFTNITVTGGLPVDSQSYNRAPPVTLADPTIDFDENSTSTVAQFAVTDGSGADLTYALSGADAALFSISDDGKLTFKLAPDYETPLDQGGNNVYDVTVATSDGAFTTIDNLTVTVADVNDTPAPVVNPGTPGDDTVNGGGGNDSLSGGVGADTVSGGAGSDVVYGNQGEDHLYGGSGSDLVYGGQDNDVVYGGSSGTDTADASDTLYGNNGDDVVYGNGGDDSVFGGQGADTAFGGQGDDVVYGGDSANSANDAGDLLYGGVGEDVIYGNGGDDSLFGNQDDDLIFGGQGNDFMHGGQGNDTLVGGVGNDTMNGGLGADTFVFAQGGGDDRIEGFNYDDGDRFDAGGQEYTSTASNGNVVVTFEDGGTVTIVGVDSIGDVFPE